VRALIQRVRESSVSVDGKEVSRIGAGMMVLLGVKKGDTPEMAKALAARISGLRIFRDEADKMNKSLSDIGGAVMVVSQMTLYGDCTKGRRPSFEEVAPGAEAQPLYGLFVETLRAAGIPVETGVFGAMMDVHLVNDGPVTFLVEP